MAACRGPEDLEYGFQSSHDDPLDITEVCDVARTTDNTPGSLPSAAGAHPDCKTAGLDVWDLIGNASEWVVQSDGTHLTAGVAFYQSAEGSTCDAWLVDLNGDPIPATEEDTDIGFRCCRDAG